MRPQNMAGLTLPWVRNPFGESSNYRQFYMQIPEGLWIVTAMDSSNCSEHSYVFCEVGNECLYAQRVPFIASPSAAALSHRKPASAGTSGDSSGARDAVKGTSCVTDMDEIERWCVRNDAGVRWCLAGRLT